MRRITLFFIALSLIFSGCTAFQIKVDSIRDYSQKKGANYILLPGLKDIDINDLNFKEYSSYVEKALSQKGFRKVLLGDKPDVIIFLAYGIGDPQSETLAYSVPIYGQTGDGSTYGVVGSQHYVSNIDMYYRWISIEGISVAEFINDKKIVPIWKTTITSKGTSGDLRRVFPYLLVAGQDYLGENTGKQIRFTIYESDSRVKALKSP